MRVPTAKEFFLIDPRLKVRALEIVEDDLLVPNASKIALTWFAPSRTDKHNIKHGTVFLSTEPPRLEVLCRIGDGSDIEKLILEAFT